MGAISMDVALPRTRNYYPPSIKKSQALFGIALLFLNGIRIFQCVSVCTFHSPLCLVKLPLCSSDVIRQ